MVRCSVYSEGKAVGVAFRLVSAHVECGVGRIGRAMLLFETGDMLSGVVPGADDDTFAVGKNIRIEAGHDDDESPLFEGAVVSHGLEIGPGNGALLRVECRDHAFPLTQGRHSRLFTDSTDSAAIGAVLGEYSSLEPSVKGTSAKYGELVQYYCPDWDWVLSLAERNGMVFVTEGKKVTIAPPAVGASPSLSLIFGPNIVSFRVEVSSDGRVPGIGARAWNPAEQKSIAGKAGKPSLNSQGSDDPAKLASAAGIKEWELQTVGAPDADTLTVWADAHSLRAALSRIRGSVTFSGSAGATAGGTLQLDGFGKHFDGTAYIGEVEHDIRDGSWTTTAHLGLPDEAPSRPTELLPTIGGLHIGKMVKADGDPAKGGRIQIELPTLNGKSNVVWARLSSSWASKGYGSMLIPDEGDELIVGFFNDDPCYPVVLGSLYSSARPQPFEVKAENDIRAMVTREGIRLVIDEKAKSVTIETPGANRLVLSDDDKGITLEDQNGNRLTMNDGGITIESSKALTLKAKTDLTASAGSAASLTAKTDLKLKGLNVEAKADASMTVKGTASAELSASGTTTIKGAMTMIN